MERARQLQHKIPGKVFMSESKDTTAGLEKKPYDLSRGACDDGSME